LTKITRELDKLSREAELVQQLDSREVRCLACAQRCLVRPGRRGICQVRFNQDGKLYAPWGYVAGLQADPVEKKPFYRFLPGSTALTFGMLGCDYHCDYCQNWLTSQALRDPASDISGQFVRRITPAQVLEYAKRTRASVVVSSYNEPLITSEWAAEIFTLVKANDLMCAYVSNGNNTPEVMEYLSPYLDAYKVDLKCMSEKNYRKLGGTLQNTLDGIKRVREMGIWVEVVTLVIPGFNDSSEELWEAARFLAGLSVDIPWHVTAFHKDYKMTEPENTGAKTLIRAAEIGREAGLRYVYAGNLPGNVGEYETTHCPKCNYQLVKRSGYVIREYKITGEGNCPKCGEKIGGLWPKNPSTVGLNETGRPMPLW